MAKTRSNEDRVRDWFAVYGPIRDELTPAPTRELLALMNSGTDVQTLNTAERLARAVMANDRMAGVIAAMLTQGGVSRPVIADSEDV